MFDESGFQKGDSVLAAAEKDELAETNNRLMEDLGKLRGELDDANKRETALAAVKIENANLSDKVAGLLDKIDALQKTNQQQAGMLKERANPHLPDAYRRDLERLEAGAAPTQIAILATRTWSAFLDQSEAMTTPLDEIDQYAVTIPAGWEFVSSQVQVMQWQTGKLHFVEFVTVRKAAD
jgi:hypothetical protein